MQDTRDVSLWGMRKSNSSSTWVKAFALERASGGSQSCADEDARDQRSRFTYKELLNLLRPPVSARVFFYALNTKLSLSEQKERLCFQQYRKQPLLCGKVKNMRAGIFAGAWGWNFAVIMKIFLYLQQSPFYPKEITIEHIYLKCTYFSA